MSTSRFRTLSLLAASAVLSAATLFAVQPAVADDTELFIGQAVAPPTARPNIMFIMDTSGSMGSDVESQAPFDPSVTWDGDFDKNRLYWKLNTQTKPPCEDSGDAEHWNDDDGDGAIGNGPHGTFAGDIQDCENNQYKQWVDDDAFKCNAAMASINSTGFGVVAKSAMWRDRSGTTNDRWENLREDGHSDTDYVECGADAGVHGVSSSSTKRYAANGSNGPWSSSSSAKIDWSTTGQSLVTYYSGNYLNWVKSPFITRTRLEIMQDAAKNLLDNMEDNVNVGLMRYSRDAHGGMVTRAIDKIETNRAGMKADIDSWTDGGNTPLSETLYEAHQYFTGGNVVWGLTSDTNTSDPKVPSVGASCVTGSCTPAGKKYKSPMTESCQKNFIVYLTDGLPTTDNESNAAIKGLIGHDCTVEPAADLEDGTGYCLDDLAKYMQETDLQAPSTNGRQNVTSYWIGFGSDVAKGTRLLELVGSGGGGGFYTASNTAELTEAFTEIVSRILSQTSTFTAPTVAVNAFNRTQNLNYLYMSVFKPSQQYRWLGNIKKYRITPAGAIRDANNNLAVDPNTGFFVEGSRSIWSDVTDGPDAELGGAAGELTDPTNRKIYTMTGAESGTLTQYLSDLKSPSTPAAWTMVNQLFFGSSSTTPLANRPSSTIGFNGLIDWAYGHDVDDEDGDSNTTEPRADMGDPLHSRPATVIYGGPADDPDLTLYATTNDGYLQAINARNGQELWSFVPKEMLGRFEELLLNEDASTREYGLDGSVEVVRLDRNGNGTIEPSGTDIDASGTIEDDEKDKVYLYFGMRRGGYHYYGLDVTVRSAPKLMWRIGRADSGIAVGSSNELPGVGQTWSAPQAARVNVNRSWGSNVDKMVLIIGGGYDIAQDTIAYTADGVGNHVYMVDALTGNLIWRAGPTADTGAQLKLAKMTNSIPGEVRVVDLTGDGYADRLYAADLGGRVLRFDLRNGQTPANLAYGGVFASIGMGDDSDHLPTTGNRRFFFAPDVSFIKSNGVTWINVAIGSGHREKPITDDVVINRFYSLRDHNVFSPVITTQYKDTCLATETLPCHQIIVDNDTRLVDVTSDITPTIPTGGAGWKMNLTDTYEKVLAESRTFQNRIFFTTYSPEQRAFNEEFCVATVGLNRLYVVDAATGKPVVNYDTATSGVTSVSDRSKELAQGSISPEAIFIFPTPDPDPNDPNAPQPAVDPICLIGLESCGTGLANPPVPTFWQQRGVN